MQTQPVQEFLALLAQALLIVALPIVIAAAVQHYRVMTARLKARVGEEQFDILQRALALAVTVAEQTGLTEGLIGPEQRARAIKFAQDYLNQRGVRIDLDKLATLVENEIRKQIESPTAPVDSPLARQELIRQAIESAVLAAEQSGLSGQILNTAIDKKAFAMDMARQNLQLYGIQANDSLINGLIEAQLLRMFLASEGAGVVPSSSEPVG
jgi:hypothetical protein